MDVPRPDTRPVHRRQVPNGIRGVAVLDQLGLRGRTRGEVQQQRVRGPRPPIRRESCRRALSVTVRKPPGDRPANSNTRVAAGNPLELRDVGRSHHHVASLSPLDAITEVTGPKQRGRGDDHRPELHRRQDRLP